MTRLFALCLLVLSGCASLGLGTHAAEPETIIRGQPPALEDPAARPRLRRSPKSQDASAAEANSDDAPPRRTSDGENVGDRPAELPPDAPYEVSGPSIVDDSEDAVAAEPVTPTFTYSRTPLPPLVEPPLVPPSQVVNADTIEGIAGIYAGGGARLDPLAGTGALGLFHYPTSWLSWRAGLAGATFSNSDERLIAGGAELGLRVQTPTQLAPFVGVGTFLGWQEQKTTTTTVSKESFWGLHSTSTTTETKTKGLATVYPEVGVIFWVSPHVYLATRAAYNFTSLRHDKESWMLGLELGLGMKPDAESTPDEGE